MFLDKREKLQRLERLKRKENLAAAERNVSGLKLKYIWTEKKHICDAFLVSFIFYKFKRNDYPRHSFRNTNTPGVQHAGHTFPFTPAGVLLILLSA